MKDLIAIVAVATAITVVVILVVLSCGKPTPPPGPDPLTEYSVRGPVSQIEGKLKPGAKATVEETKRYMQTAADIID